jgi:hypothetical protein
VVQEESNKIYFEIFGHSYKFVQILKVCHIFWNYLTKTEKGKRFNSARAEIWPTAIVLGPAVCHARRAETGVRPRLGGSAQRGKRPACVDVVTTRRPHAGRRGGALTGGSSAAR